MNQSLVEASELELSERLLSVKGPVMFWYRTNNNDTTSVVQKTIVTADTTLHLEFDKRDPFITSKILQFQLKFIAPLDVSRLDSILKKQLIRNSFPFKETCVDYIDLKKDTLIERSSLKSALHDFYQSDTISLDAISSIGVKAYAKTAYLSILDQMGIQLVLSILLISGASFCLIWLLRIVIRQNDEVQDRVDFVNNLVHDINRPATGIKMLLELATSKLSEGQIEQVARCINNVTLETERMERYIKKKQDDLMCEDKVYAFNKIRMELLPFLEERKDWHEQNAAKEMQITIDADDDAYIYTDKQHFSDIINNLIENSIKYSNENVQIKISAAASGGLMKITVWDNGWGIPKDDIKHIFEKFYRSKSHAKREKKGFGLGLNCVKAVVEKLGGCIEVHSKEGVYTEFVLWMPMK